MSCSIALRRSPKPGALTAAAIIGEIERWFAGPAAEEIFSHSKSPEQRLADYIAFLSEQRHRDNHGDPLGNLLAELGDVEPFSKALRKAEAALLDRLESVVTEYALERGSRVDARAVARMLAAEIHGLSALYKVDREDAPFDEGLRRVQSIMETMAAPQPVAQPGSVHPPTT
jgi:AcrR family transcriptional regulator